MRIVGVLLAAGRGVRFGGDKLLAPLPVAVGEVPAGTPIGVASARNLGAALAEVLVVTRPGEPLLAARLRAEGARTIECPDAQRGMGATLACGVAASSDADGWLIALADMPWVTPATIAAVAAALASGADIAAPVYRGTRGHPVGFARSHRRALLACSGDEGARGVIAAHREHLVPVDVDDRGVVRDVDTPADLDAG